MIKELIFFVIFCCKIIFLFLQSELSTIREQLLNDFIPDDVCPLGSQLFTGSSYKIPRVDLENNESLKGVNIVHVFFVCLLIVVTCVTLLLSCRLLQCFLQRMIH